MGVERTQSEGSISLWNKRRLTFPFSLQSTHNEILSGKEALLSERRGCLQILSVLSNTSGCCLNNLYQRFPDCWLLVLASVHDVQERWRDQVQALKRPELLPASMSQQSRTVPSCGICWIVQRPHDVMNHYRHPAPSDDVVIWWFGNELTERRVNWIKIHALHSEAQTRLSPWACHMAITGIAHFIECMT